MGVKVRERPKGSGVWWVFIDHHEIRKAKKCGDKKTAETVKQIVETNLLLGKPLFGEDRKPRVPTLADFYSRFEREYLTIATRETTRSSYTNNFNKYILPRFGGQPLNEITRGQVTALIADLVQGKQGPFKKDLAKPTIRIIAAELCAMLNHAIEEEIIFKNPAARLGKYFKNAKVKRREVERLTREEVSLFLQEALEHTPKYYPIFLCAIHTGMRAAELAGLQWGDIDFNGKFIRVRRMFVRGNLVDTTKTGEKGERNIDMSDTLITVLKDFKRKHKEEWLEKGFNEIPDWVFCNRKGKPMDMNNLRNRPFHKCLENAGLRRIRFHDLRHSFASLLIEDGQPLAYVKEQLGHSTIKLTVDVYGHLVPGTNREAMNRLPNASTVHGNQ